MHSASERQRRLLEQIVEQRRLRRNPGENGASPAEERFAASFSQEGLWFLHKLFEVGCTYNVAILRRLRGSLDTLALERAFSEIVRRHEALRTRFEEAEDGATQVVDAAREFRLVNADLSALDETEQDAEMRGLLDEHSRAPFSLADGPLIRVTLLKLSEQHHVLLIVLHHIVSDAWSAGILTRELGVLYAAFHRGEPSQLPELEVQYADYSVWQRQWLQGEVRERLIEYWRKQLADAPLALELPTDRPRATMARFEGASVPVGLSAELSAALTKIARKERTSLFMLLMAAFHALLSRWSGQRDVLIGTPIAGRGLRQTEEMIGFFVNMLPIRARALDHLSFRAFLKQVRETALDAYDHQDIPFETLVTELRPNRDLSRTPIFQALLVLQNQEQAQQPFVLGELEIGTFPGNEVASKYELSLYLQEKAEGIQGYFEYRTDLFDAATIERLAGHFAVLLEGVARNPDTTLGELPLLRPREREQLLESFNDTRVEYGETRYIHQLFEQQAQEHPQAVAVVFEDDCLSYAQLNAHANQLAHSLRSRGIRPEDRVALCVERSLEMVVGVLGILKAGATYVPLDPQYPVQRLQYMIEDCAPALLLTHAAARDRVPTVSMPVLQLDLESPDAAVAASPRENLPVQSIGLLPGHPAYLTYTSGSTGQPKGVLNTHAGIRNRLLWGQHALALDTTDRVLQKTSYSFDISVWELFWPLMFGARLVLARPGGQRDNAYLVRLIQAQDITVLHFVPPMLQLFLKEPQCAACRSLRHVVSGGQELPAALAQEFFKVLPAARLHNLYGPTEVSIEAACYTCSPEDRARSVSVGRPIANTQIHILDAWGELTPIGVTGEICIGGVGVARGYWRRPRLTADRFVPDPFSDQAGARLYRTGDLGRWRADGNIEFLGRNDFQVKIRGFRVELGEIESALMRHPAVSQAVVLSREVAPGDMRLVAYVVAKPDMAMPAGEVLRAELKASLPEYMVPAAFIELATMPLNPNGKIDRKALPAPEGAASNEREYVAPRTPNEQLLAQIWAETLVVERVGIHDNFFELGGHSLLTLRIVARIAERTGISLPAWTVFQSPTVAALALRMEEPTSFEDDAMAEEFEAELAEGVM